MRSVEATARFWSGLAPGEAARLSGDTPPGVRDGEGFTVTRTRYLPAPGAGAPVELWKVGGAGHFMPTRDYPAAPGSLAVARFGRECRAFESAEVAWRFFLGKEKPRRP
jgi:poly(3-hydroxybutyrate) depolymerase